MTYYLGWQRKPNADSDLPGFTKCRTKAARFLSRVEADTARQAVETLLDALCFDCWEASVKYHDYGNGDCYHVVVKPS